MRLSFALLLLCPAFAPADDAARKKETVDWLLAREDPKGGFHPAADAKPAPGLRATSAAVRALKYLGAEVPNKEKHAAFVLGCFDPKTGGFAEPGGKPDVFLTSVGVMAAVELGVPREKFAKAMDYLKENAKTFEEVRIGAGAVEAWGVKDCPFPLDDWKAFGRQLPGVSDPKSTTEALKDGEARAWGSLVAWRVRLGFGKPGEGVRTLMTLGQRDDGGWGKEGEKTSDLETTYRVMRAFYLLRDDPRPDGDKQMDPARVRKFVAAHRNKDGGYAAKPGEASAAGPTYYAAIISKWLDEMEKK